LGQAVPKEKRGIGNRSSERPSQRRQTTTKARKMGYRYKRPRYHWRQAKGGLKRGLRGGRGAWSCFEGLLGNGRASGRGSHNGKQE